jgi:hypothetical protein
VSHRDAINCAVSSPDEHTVIIAYVSADDGAVSSPDEHTVVAADILTYHGAICLTDECANVITDDDTHHSAIDCAHECSLFCTIIASFGTTFRSAICYTFIQALGTTIWTAVWTTKFDADNILPYRSTDVKPDISNWTALGTAFG